MGVVIYNNVDRDAIMTQAKAITMSEYKEKAEHLYSTLEEYLSVLYLHKEKVCGSYGYRSGVFEVLEHCKAVDKYYIDEDCRPAWIEYKKMADFIMRYEGIDDVIVYIG